MKIDVRGVTVRYGATAALDGVTVTLPERSFTGIVGPNGAGKSTLLRCMHAAVRPAGGVVLLDGADVASRGPLELARAIGLVPQNSTPRFPYTVAHYVAMGRYAHEAAGCGREASRAAVRRAMETAGVARLAERTVDGLSGGEFRRVLLAQVFAQETKVLLLDEPLQQLDLRHQLDVMLRIRAFAAADGASAAAVLHDLGMAARFCDSLLLLHQGRVVACGTPAQVITPANVRLAYGVEAVVRTCDATGALEVVAVRAVPSADEADGPRLAPEPRAAGSEPAPRGSWETWRAAAP